MVRDRGSIWAIEGGVKLPRNGFLRTAMDTVHTTATATIIRGYQPTIVYQKESCQLDKHVAWNNFLLIIY